ncbi:MAG: hypothetical protein AAF543_20085, partial [Pseudomonadota bacterium]
FDGFDRREARLQDILMIFESWLEIATKQEMQARQSRHNLVFAALTAGVGFAMLLVHTGKDTFVFVPLVLMTMCSTMFNHLYHRKAASWKKTSKEVVKVQWNAFRSNNPEDIYEQISEFDVYKTYKMKKKSLRLWYLDTPSLLLYVTLSTFIISFLFMFDFL